MTRMMMEQQKHRRHRQEYHRPKPRGLNKPSLDIILKQNVRT